MGEYVSGPAYLVVEDVPLYPIGLPFGFFPKQEKQASGIIMPKFGEEARRGFYLREGGIIGLLMIRWT
jgi:lipopolysaccharide assembly outer membrane protein LptD (OstA)